MTTVKADRDTIEADLTSATVDMKDQFLAALAQDGVINEAAVSVPGIGRALDPLRQAALTSLADQDQLIAEIQQAHAAFVAANGSASGSREAFLSELASAHNYFVELQDNLKEGIKFYNNLTELLLALQTKIGDYSFARKTEKDELLKDLTHESSRAAAVAAPVVPAHFPEPAAAAAASSAPYPSQMQGMPMPYGATQAAPYPTYQPPPMPTGYNPYATLPYPNSEGASLCVSCRSRGLTCFVCLSFRQLRTITRTSRADRRCSSSTTAPIRATMRTCSSTLSPAFRRSSPAIRIRPDGTEPCSPPNQTQSINV